jgi:predicted phage terminase large subunit-like protein
MRRYGIHHSRNRVASTSARWRGFSGTQLIQELIREGVYAVTRYQPTLEKKMRLHSVTNTIENGFVYLPTKADWLACYLHEVTTFPNGKHDDQADSTSQALDWAKQWPSRLPLEEFHERQLLRWKLNLSEEYIFKQCDEGEDIIAEHFTYRPQDPVERPILGRLRLRISDYSVHKLFRGPVERGLFMHSSA